MALQLPYGLSRTTPGMVDEYAGPYNSTSAAQAAVPDFIKPYIQPKIGDNFYQWVGGVSLSNLVLKIDQPFLSSEKTKLSTVEQRANHTGVQSADTIVDGTANKAYTAADKALLNTHTTDIATNAANIASAASAGIIGVITPASAAPGTTPTTPIAFELSGTGTYTNYLSASSTPITFNASTEGKGIIRFNPATGYYVKVTTPVSIALTKTISALDDTPDQLGQLAKDSFNRIFYADTLSGTVTNAPVAEKFKKFVKHSDITMMFEPYYGNVLGISKISNNSIKFTGGASTYLINNQTIQLEVTRSGTVTTTSGSPIIIGVGTFFSTEVTVGALLYNTLGSFLGTVASIQSDTQLTLTGNAVTIASAFAYSTDFTFTFSGNNKILCLDTTKKWVFNGNYRKYSIGGNNSCLVEKDASLVMDATLVPLCGFYNSTIDGFHIGIHLKAADTNKVLTESRAYGDMVFEPFGGGTLNIDFPAYNQIRFKEKVYMMGKPNGHLLGLYSDSFPVTYTFPTNLGGVLVLDTSVSPIVDGIQSGYDKHFIDGGSNSLSIISFTEYDASKHVILAVFYPLTNNGEGGIIPGTGLIGKYYGFTLVTNLLGKDIYNRLTFSPYSGGVSNASFTGVRTLSLAGPTYLHGKANSKIIQLYSSLFPISYTFLNDTITSQNLVFDTRAPFKPNLVSNGSNTDYDQYNINPAKTGTITTSTGSKTVTGVSTLALTELFVGERIYDSTATLIGTVASIESNTSFTLVANAAIAVTGSIYSGLSCVYIETQEATNTDYHIILLHSHKGTIVPSGLFSSFYLSNKLTATSVTPYRLNADKVSSNALLYSKDEINNNTFMFVQGNDFHTVSGNNGRLENFSEMVTYASEASGLGLPIKFALANGDLTDGLQSTKSGYQVDVNTFKAAYNASNILTLNSIGNHDDNSYINLFAQVYTKADQRANFMDIMTTKFPSAGITFGPASNACYYFMDDASSKVRVIVLDPLDIPYVANGSALKYQGLAQYSFSDTQLNWLAGTALNLSSKTTDASNWHTLISCHVPIRNTGVGEFMHPTNIVPRIVNAFKNGLALNEVFTDTVNGGDFSYSVTKNFTTQNGGGLPFIGYFSGHRHKDSINVDSEFSDQTNIVVNNAWTLRDYQPSNNVNLDSRVNRTYASITQNSFDLMIVDKSSRKVRALRFGAGQDLVNDPTPLFQRSFTY